MRYIGNQCKDAYSSPGSSVVESSVVKIKYSAANCIFNPLWSNTVFRIDILRPSARSPCQLFIYLFVLCLLILEFTDVLLCYFFAEGGATQLD